MAHDEENENKRLMAKIDTNAGETRRAPVEPVAQKYGDPLGVEKKYVLQATVPMEEPPSNPPAYTPPATERWGKLMSRVNYPLEVQHQEGAIRLSPRAVVTVDGNKLVGDVPTGARFVPDRR